jgi:hypothetical protein
MAISLCWVALWRRMVSGYLYGGKTMQNQEKTQWRRGLTLLCRQADTQQQGCYASKA